MELDLEELGLAATEITEGEILPPAPARRVRRMRDAHHTLARLVAIGLTDIEAGAISGYSPAYISGVLRPDPTFQQLVAFYQENANAASADVVARMAELKLRALEIMLERLEDNPDSASYTTLLEMFKSTADRTGYGPHSKSTNVNVNVDIAARLDAARKRIAA